MADRTVAVALIARVQGYRAQIGTAIASTKEFRTELDNMRQNSKANFQQLQMNATIAGAAMLALAGWATKVGMEFDKQMSEVQAITNATADDLGKLRVAALDAGKATVFSAREAAQAEAELAKAGLSTSDILGGALAGSLALASAGSLDLAEAASVAAKTMGQFQLKGKDVGRIADLLAGAANASATDVHELGEALKMGGGAAHAAGMDVEQTTTVLTAFAKQALVGSDAGTSLKTMLMMLQAPTDKAKAKMKELGLNVYDANGNMVDAYELSGRLQKAFAGMTQEARNAAIVTIFGADAQRSANALYQVGSAGLKQLNREMLAQADAARVAAVKTDNLAGDLERLKGSLESMAIDSSTGAAGGLRFLIQSLDTMVGKFSDLPGGIQSTVVILAGLSGATLLAAVGFMKVRGAVADVASSMRAAGPVMGKFATGLETSSKWAMRAAGAFAVWEVATAALTAALHTELNPQLDATTKGLQDWNQKTDLAGEAARLFGADASDLTDALKYANATGFGAALNKIDEVSTSLFMLGDVYDTGADKIHAFDAALTQMVQDGHAQQAGQVVEEMAKRAGLSVDQVTSKIPGYKAALETASQAALTQAVQAEATKTANIKLAGAFGEAASAADGLTDAFNKLNGAELDWRGAQRGAEAAVDDLKKALEESNGSLDVHEEKGRAAAAAVDELAKKAADAAQKKYDETHSIEEANKVYGDYVGQLRALLTAAGMSKDKVDELVSSITKMPEYKPITIDVKLAGNWGEAKSLIDAEHASIHVTPRASGGDLQPGVPYLFGENGPEVGVFSRAGYMHPSVQAYRGAMATGGALGGSGATSGPMVIENHIEIGGEVVRVVRAEISEDNRDTRRRVLAGSTR